MTTNNPYNLKVGGFAPTQGSGTLPKGEYYYIRSRSKTTIDICKNEPDWWDRQYLFQRADKTLEYLEEEPLIKWATEQINEYYEQLRTAP